MGPRIGAETSIEWSQFEALASVTLALQRRKADDLLGTRAISANSDFSLGKYSSEPMEPTKLRLQVRKWLANCLR